MAGEYIEFNNNSQPALNDTNINRLQQLIKQDIQGAVSGDTLPIGAIFLYGSDIIPENWLLCNGQAVSRTEYQALFNTIGTTFGQGDGFTTFNLPDLRGKVAVGKDGNDTDFNTLGKIGGEKEHTLTEQEMPSHHHALYTYGDTGTPSGRKTRGTGNPTDARIADGGTEYRGGSQPHNILQPYQVQNYIIKAKQSAGVVATVVDSLNSTSATDALSANQGRLLKGITLFENANGVGSGTDITLNETAANYNYLEFFYKRASTEDTLESTKIESPNNKQVGMSIIYASSDTLLQLYGARMRISGTNVTWSGSTLTTISGTSISSTSATDVLKVYKIIGYK